jgi:hypothetical protein
MLKACYSILMQPQKQRQATFCFYAQGSKKILTTKTMYFDHAVLFILATFFRLVHTVQDHIYKRKSEITSDKLLLKNILRTTS